MLGGAFSLTAETGSAIAADGSSDAAVALCAPSGAPAGHISHIFSHVRFEADVYVWTLEGRAPRDLAADVARAGSVEARWVPLAEVADGLGLTTFAAKLLFPARGVLFAMSSDAGDAAAAAALDARWAKAGVAKSKKKAT